MVIARWRNGKHFKDSLGCTLKLYHGLTIVSPTGATSARLRWGMVGCAVLLRGAAKAVSWGGTSSRLTRYGVVSSKGTLRGVTASTVLRLDFFQANQVEHGW
jgi:hypothetical protein